MKDALGEYIASSTKGKEVERLEDETSIVGGGIKAILVGTRRGDPHGGMPPSEGPISFPQSN